MVWSRTEYCAFQYRTLSARRGGVKCTPETGALLLLHEIANHVSARSYYSGYPIISDRDERGAHQSTVHGVNDILIMFSDGRDVAADSAECLGTGMCSETT